MWLKNQIIYGLVASSLCLSVRAETEEKAQLERPVNKIVYATGKPGAELIQITKLANGNKLFQRCSIGLNDETTANALVCKTLGKEEGYTVSELKIAQDKLAAQETRKIEYVAAATAIATAIGMVKGNMQAAKLADCIWSLRLFYMTAKVTYPLGYGSAALFTTYFITDDQQKDIMRNLLDLVDQNTLVTVVEDVSTQADAITTTLMETVP